LAFTEECPDALLKRALFGTRGTMRNPFWAVVASIWRCFAPRALQATLPEKRR
jgi:hypothetical protein